MSKDQVDSIYQVTDTHIRGFFKEYRFLSNFEVCPVAFEGLIYPSSEAAYQAAKTKDHSLRAQFLNLNASEAKKAGQLLPLRGDWKEVRDDFMFKILCDKFTRNEELRLKLIATGDKHLEETNWWGDVYWGVCRGRGMNHLGLVLMKVREELLNS